MSDTKPDFELAASVTSGSQTSGAASLAAPLAEPPSLTNGGSGAGAVDASTWVNNKKINALWAISENRNSWVGVAGAGWVKLANNSDSAVVALSVLGASAKLTQGTVNYRQEADSMIHEMYVW